MGLILKVKSRSPENASWRGELRWLLSHGAQYRWEILAVSLLGLAGAAMGLGSGVASKYLIDAVTGRSRRMLGRAIFWMGAAAAGSLGLSALSSRLSGRIHVRVKSRLLGAVYGHILRAEWEALEPYRDGDLLNRLNGDVSVVSGGMIQLIPTVAASFAKCLGAFLLIGYYDPVMAVMILLGTPVTLALFRTMMGRLRRQDRQIKALSGMLMAFQAESLRNLTAIKAFAAGERFEAEQRRLQKKYGDACLKQNAFHVGMTVLISLAGTALTASCLFWGVYQLWAGRVSYGSMALFARLAAILRASLSSLAGAARQTISLMTSAGRIMALEDLPEENLTAAWGLRQETGLDIALTGVSFRYKNGGTVLDTFQFTAHHGDLIAITGPSGGGKTTFLRLLLGLVSPCGGTAELVGSSGTRYPIAPGTRWAFAYVPQRNSMFSGTIADNLRLIRPDADEKALEQALRAACAWEFVSRFPEGIYHRLGAGGRGISEGQAQRLAIARALLGEAPILLLDEATSALDEATERKLLANLREPATRRTCILVTHRPGAAQFCGSAYEIRRGRLIRVDGP